MKKIAVILFNLGGPDNLEAVKPFLRNLFNDPAIIRLPEPFRNVVAWFISMRREKVAQEIYAKIGGASPILENTLSQARALETKLSEAGWVRCFVAMRYWHPFAEETAEEVRRFVPDEIVLLPLYPQFSTTTTASSLKAWGAAALKAGITAPTRSICCYPEQDGFIATLAASAETARQEAAVYGKPRLLFSAHGLPEKIIEAGDPYAWQCEHTAEALASALGAEKSDWVLCYQSRVGPLKWIGPSTDQEILRAGRDKVPVVIVPIAFVSEHSETLVEIDMEYRHLAERSGVPFFAVVPTVSIAPLFIEGLAKLVREALASETDCFSEKGQRLCPPEFSGCCQTKQPAH